MTRSQSISTSRGPCAKRQVTCVIKRPDTKCGGVTIVGVGRNDCVNPQLACPRLPGEGYEKCQSVCGQSGHAELMALQDALRNTSNNVRGCEAHLWGHYWMCEPCGRALRDAGIDRVVVHNEEPPKPMGWVESCGFGEDETFTPGQRVIYTRLGRPWNTEWLATYVRESETANGVMHVIALDEAPKPRTVGRSSIRAA